MVVTCKVVSSSDLQIIKNYIKNIEYIDVMGIDVSCLPQSKSYLKIIGISYYPHDDPSTCLLSNDVKVIINIRNRPATEPVTLKVRNVKLSFDIWLVLYMYFILYS